MGIVREGDVVVLRGGSQKPFLAVAWSVFVLIGLSMVTYGGAEASSRVLGWALILSFTWTLLRLVRVQVRASPDGLVIRGWWRSRRLGWSEVVGAEVVGANPSNGLFGILQVTEGSGRRTKVDGLGFWARTDHPEALPVAVMADEINTRAAAQA